MLASTANGHTLAHEVGHASGLDDIYMTYTATNGVTASIANAGVVKSEYLDPRDWGSGYYPYDLLHTDLIKRLLMYGEGGYGGTGVPHGDVWGVRLITVQIGNGEYIRQPTTEGKARVGLESMNRNPKHLY